MGIKTSIRCLLVAETFAIVLNNPDSIPLSAFYLFSYYFLSFDKVPHRLREKRGAKSDSIYRIHIQCKLKEYGLQIS